MTRINCIPATDLTRQHLVAEYRELPRVFTLAVAAHKRGYVQQQNVYTLGTGHVKFFYTRLKWLRNRFRELHQEMRNRGYTTNLPVDLGDYTEELPAEWNQDWVPTPAAKLINLERIALRLREAA